MDRTALISFDGLNAAQFEHLLSMMPKFASLTQSESICDLDSAPFSESQPIWAEILTGRPWYENGCTGYAKPSSSLNATSVFTEQDLLVHNLLLPKPHKQQIHIVVNAPLTDAVEGERIWLATPSSPTLNVVYPQSLASEEPFSKYRPRPVISMSEAMANSKEAIAKFIETEKNRIDCVSRLAKKQPWQVLVYRATIFDHAAHLLGPNFLFEKQLQISTQLRELIGKLEDLLCQLVLLAQRHIVFSAFSHNKCRFLFSLNDLFAHRGFLARVEVPSETLRRRQAFTHVRGDEAPLVTHALQIAPNKTICSSPTRGVIYINAKDSFADGTVSTNELQRTEDRLHSLLTEELCKLGPATIHRNPHRTSGMPSFIVDIRSIEFVDSLPSIYSNHDVPSSTHQSNGFVYLSKTETSSHIKPINLIDVLGAS